ncbi:sulfite exporter TauE/SafE family protein [Pseudenhygromyxa sp. WMMC2535]|uniref:sulfite exporter TauE/SafE family protein n=1 Tax=Pseudenhygromyxa sp. WMMC2535 TaxID=2712867 RepID=UPI0015546D90|nr:sulfite exporter TauE/SafE family protein [Pseudenhygromyxa sp. WMMC2535]NVB40393.1 sulfite exporter TauE/SafE family protein [Pseudenhygromyxa sp. WMMC2535]
MSPLEYALLMVAGLLTATLSGVLGMGGGVTLLGVMTALLPAPTVVPVHGVVQLVSNSTRALGLLRNVVWRVVWLYAPPMVLGVAAATAIWSGDKLVYLRPAVGLLLIVFLIVRRKAPKLRNPPRWVYAALGLVVGFASVWIGATGPMLAPFFLRDDFEKEQVIATKAACQALGHMLKIPAFLFLGFDFLEHAPLLGGLVVTVIVGTLVGRAILTRLDRERFVGLFEAILLLLSLWLIVGVFV